MPVMFPLIRIIVKKKSEKINNCLFPLFSAINTAHDKKCVLAKNGLIAKNCLSSKKVI